MYLKTTKANIFVAGAAAMVTSLLLSNTAMAKSCELKIFGNDQMQYVDSGDGKGKMVKELTVDKDCTDIKVTLTHAGKLPKASMGHYWILVKTPDFTAVNTDAMKAGPAKDYLPAGDKRVIANTKMVGGGESATTEIKKSALTAGGDYTFFCSFPGHSGLMKGKLVVK